MKKTVAARVRSIAEKFSKKVDPALTMVDALGSPPKREDLCRLGRVVHHATEAALDSLGEIPEFAEKSRGTLQTVLDTAILLTEAAAEPVAEPVQAKPARKTSKAKATSEGNTPQPKLSCSDAIMRIMKGTKIHSTEEIIAILLEKGHQTGNVHHCLSKLAKQGTLTREGRGFYRRTVENSRALLPPQHLNGAAAHP